VSGKCVMNVGGVPEMTRTNHRGGRVKWGKVGREIDENGFRLVCGDTTRYIYGAGRNLEGTGEKVRLPNPPWSRTRGERVLRG